MDNRGAARTMLMGAACALALVAGPGASADARFAKGEAGASVKVAWSYWHSLRPGMFDGRNSGCRPGAVEIDWRHDMGHAMASAPISGCQADPPTITVEGPTMTKLSDRHGCAVITHEFGHLLGYGHARNQRSLMSGIPSDGIRPPGKATWRRAWRRCENSR